MKPLLPKGGGGKRARIKAAAGVRAGDVGMAGDQGFVDLGFARVDTGRATRCGFPEVIFGSGKQPEQIAKIAVELKKRGQPVLVTRTDDKAWRAVKKVLPGAKYHPLSGMIVWDEPGVERLPFRVCVCSAGTSDQRVCEEASVTAGFLGLQVSRESDVGVAGLHRLLARIESLRQVDMIIAVAGMEAALPSVVGGLVSTPIVAVPTSTGYGANLGGLAALLAVLNTCASGVVVVNVDNGFGAACHAGRVARVMIMGR